MLLQQFFKLIIKPSGLKKVFCVLNIYLYFGFSCLARSQFNRGNFEGSPSSEVNRHNFCCVPVSCSSVKYFPCVYLSRQRIRKINQWSLFVFSNVFFDADDIKERLHLDCAHHFWRETF